MTLTYGNDSCTIPVGAFESDRAMTFSGTCNLNGAGSITSDVAIAGDARSRHAAVHVQQTPTADVRLVAGATVGVDVEPAQGEDSGRVATQAPLGGDSVQVTLDYSRSGAPLATRDAALDEIFSKQPQHLLHVESFDRSGETCTPVN
jgi:hypothetical protein